MGARRNIMPADEAAWFLIGAPERRAEYSVALG